MSKNYSMVLVKESAGSLQLFSYVLKLPYHYVPVSFSSSDSWAGFHVGRIPRQGTLVQTKSNILSCWQCSCVFRVVSSSWSRRETTSCLPQCQCLRIKYISNRLLSRPIFQKTTLAHQTVLTMPQLDSNYLGLFALPSAARRRWEHWIRLQDGFLHNTKRSLTQFF